MSTSPLAGFGHQGRGAKRPDSNRDDVVNVVGICSILLRGSPKKGPLWPASQGHVKHLIQCAKCLDGDDDDDENASMADSCRDDVGSGV